MRATRLSPLTFRTRRSISGARWWRSATTSTVTPSVASPQPMGPTSRWWSGFIALPKCVMCDAPASSASSSVEASASVCPMETRKPLFSNARTTAIPPGISGASVVIERPGRSPSASKNASSVLGSLPSRKHERWSAPQRAAETNGPSKWIPRGIAPRPSPARRERIQAERRATVAAISPSGCGTSVGRKPEMPRRGQPQRRAGRDRRRRRSARPRRTRRGCGGPRPETTRDSCSLAHRACLASGRLSVRAAATLFFCLER